MPKHVMTIESAKAFEEASKTALADMVNVLSEQTTLSREEAYALVGEIANIKIGNVVDREVTARITVPKCVFAHARRKRPGLRPRSS